MQQNIHPPSRQTAMQTLPSYQTANQTPPSLRGAKRRSSLGVKLLAKLKTLFKLLLLSITLTTTLLAQDMFRPPYESTLNIEPRAKQWYNEAAADSSSAYNIGVVYDKVLKQYKKAEKWYLYSVSLDKKNNDAIFNLALLYENQYKNYEKAIKFYEKAAKYNHTKSLAALGRAYELGLNDLETAKQWYQKAIDNGDSTGIRLMAWMYHDMDDDITASAYMFNLIAYYAQGSKTKEKKELKETIAFLKDEWHLDDQTIQKGYELQLTMDNLPKKYRGGVR